MSGGTTLPSARAIAVGEYHGCALLSDGTVACWGQGSSGQRGDGTLADSPVPVVVPGLSGVTAIVASGERTCALVAGGSVACWGETYGDGPHALPMLIPDLSNTVALGVGWYHPCAVHTNGRITCWGANTNGQRGDGTMDDSRSQVDVARLPSAMAVAASEGRTCAWLDEGGIACWGLRDYFSTGITPNDLQPVFVDGL